MADEHLIVVLQHKAQITNLLLPVIHYTVNCIFARHDEDSEVSAYICIVSSKMS